MTPYFAIVPALLLLPPIAAQHEAKAATKDIVTTAVQAGSFTTLATALTKAGLVEALKGDGPFTVFAPTDDAFAKVDARTLASLLEPANKEQLVAVLKYHVVPGRVTADAVVKLTGATTLNGQRIDIQAKDGVVRVDDATVVKTDIACSNGVIHVIDRVILPNGKNLVETAAAAGRFQTLLAAAKAAGLADTLANKGPFTVFAPTDAAFARLPKGTLDNLLKPENKDQLAAILSYHVVAGRVYAGDAVAAGNARSLQGGNLKIQRQEGTVRVNDATVVMTDLDAGNGVIHVIDTVILPPR